jgi:hypothetical protein
MAGLFVESSIRRSYVAASSVTVVVAWFELTLAFGFIVYWIYYFLVWRKRAENTKEFLAF